MEHRSCLPRREIDIMLASAVFEAPEREFDDEDWDDGEFDPDELDVDLDEEGVELDDEDEDF
jgi:hypothetical protein